MNDFIDKARYLSRNPLGIIALFISLIYGFACLVLSVASKNLSTCERQPLIWFLIIFPFIILISFLYLVVKHHHKLYAPSDYKNDDNFFKTVDISKQKEKLEENVKEIILESIIEQSDEINSRNYEYIQQEYLLAENLVFKTIEQEYNSPVSRSVASNKFYFDGMLDLPNQILAFELKYTKIGKIDKELVLSRAVKNYDYVNELHKPKITRLILLIVHEGKNVDKLIQDAENIVQKSNRLIEYRLFNIFDLMDRFGILRTE